MGRRGEGGGEGRRGERNKNIAPYCQFLPTINTEFLNKH